MKRFFLWLVWPLFTYSSPTTTVEFIKIDQFGYRQTAEKVAVISDPQNGYNAALSFNPGTSYEVRDWYTDAIVHTGNIQVWNSGATHTQSGDKVWWYDFSTLTTPGDYYIFDPINNVGSYQFRICNSIYLEVLKQSLRMFYYQRCGAAKLSAHTTTAWSDATCHAGTTQDTDCRLYNNTNVSTSLNLSGGWHDAGDYNKYVNFTFSTMQDLLLAYRENPLAFGDDYNIPESGNSIPDILDEVKYELDWLLKMQQSNGSLLTVIGGGGTTPPSTDTQQRKYGPASTSATFTGSAIFALAAKIYNSIGQTTYGATLQTAAINAWNWATANPGITFYNSGILAAGENETNADGLFTRHLVAAIYLYDLTGNATYKTYVDNNYTSAHLLQWQYVYPFENEMQDALLHYTTLPNVSTTVYNAIRNAYANSVSTNNADNLPAYLNETDAYRAYVSNNNYTWNSNKTKACQGNIFLNMNVYGLNPANNSNYTNAAQGILNYFHGVNPNSKTYLSNMAGFGAENSVSQFYHGWFHDGSSLWDEVGVSTYGPAPGFIPGGPNPSYALDACCPSSCGSTANNALCATNVTPPLNQPIQKSYKDFNDSWPLNSWTVTEAGIYTNASYVRLLSKFCNINDFCSITGIQVANSAKTKLFPNPANNLLNVEMQTSGEMNWMIVDALGNLIIEGQKINGNHWSVDIQNLTPGVYCFLIRGKNLNETIRFTKV